VAGAARHRWRALPVLDLHPFADWG
jgi:hypothetical protein